MARQRSPDRATAIRGALDTFARHGFAGASVEMLSSVMHMCRQSMYHEFGDKWQLYIATLRRYIAEELHESMLALHSGQSCLEGVDALFDYVIGSINSYRATFFMIALFEFGSDKSEVRELIEGGHVTLSEALRTRLCEGQAKGEVASTLDAGEAATFILGTCASIQAMARLGNSTANLRAMARMAIRALSSVPS